MAANTANPIEVAIIPITGKTFHLSHYNTNLTGCENLVAGVANTTHYLKKIMIRTATAMTITIGSGEEPAGSVETIHIGPVPLDAASGFFAISFGEKGIKCVKGKAITIDASAAGAVWIYAEGFTVIERP